MGGLLQHAPTTTQAQVGWSVPSGGSIRVCMLAIMSCVTSVLSTFEDY